MEIDLPKDAISKSQWLLNNAKKAENIYEARSWLITARNAAPGRGCKTGRKSNCVRCEIAIPLSKSNSDCEKSRKIMIFSFSTLKVTLISEFCNEWI